MPETFAVFMFSLGEAQRYLEALCAAGEDDLAEPFLDILDQDDGPPELAEPLLSAAQMIELAAHIRARYGNRCPRAPQTRSTPTAPSSPRPLRRAAMADAARYAIVAVAVHDLRCMWVEIWRTRGRTDAIELAQDLLDGGYARAAVVQGRGTPDEPTPPGEAQIYQGVAGGYRADAFFPLMPRERIDERPYLLAVWRPVWAAVPRDHPARAADIYGQVAWRRSYGQFLHALRQMRTAGLLTSPARGQYQRVRRQQTAAEPHDAATTSASHGR